MSLTCPQCHNSLEAPPEPSSGEVLCPSCGSSFLLDGMSTQAWSGAGALRRLGRFELLDVVGSGAFGTV